MAEGTNLSVDVDADLLGRLLLRVEADAHRRGWDQPPALLVLYDSGHPGTGQAYRRVLSGRAGPPTRCGPYVAQPAVPSDLLPGRVAHALFRFALNLAHAGDHPAVVELLAGLRQPGFLGVALQCESWVREGGAEEHASWRGKRFADIPGSREQRLVNACDVACRDYLVSRQRGERPRVEISDRDDVTGSVYESLRMIVAVVADLPRPEMSATPSGWSWDEQRSGPEEGS